MAYMPTLPSVSPILKNLTYVIEDSPSSPSSFGGSPFGGYPYLKQRNDSFDIKDSMCVHCGYGLFLLDDFMGKKSELSLRENIILVRLLFFFTPYTDSDN